MSHRIIDRVLEPLRVDHEIDDDQPYIQHIYTVLDSNDSEVIVTKSESAARLFAAAPRLRDALRGLVDESGLQWSEDDDLWESARSVLAFLDGD